MTATTKELAYQRVALDQFAGRAEDGGADTATAASAAARTKRFRTWIVIPMSLLFCCVAVIIASLAANVESTYVSSTLVPVIGMAILAILVLLFNPLLKLLRIRNPLSRVELMAIFAAMMITSGVSNFGLADQLVPLIAAPFNPQWNTKQRGWQEEVIPYLNESLYISDPQTVLTFRQGLTHTRGDNPEAIVVPAPEAPLRMKLAYYWTVFSNIAWGQWIPPLMAWGVFLFAAYAMFYSLSYIVLDYWSNREKIIFPLAKLPESLLPDPDGSELVPAMLKSPGFWWGFALSFFVLTYNVAVQAGWITGLSPIALGARSNVVAPLLEGTIFAGAAGSGQYSLTFHIIFVAIGIAFLLPVEISFSVWFYFLVAKTILLVMVWMGFGQNLRDFPSDWLWLNNPVSALGSGGMLLFAGISLVRCIAEYRNLVRGKALGQKLRIGAPVLVFFGSLILMIGWFQWNHVPWYWGALFVAFLTLLTLGLMRIVAEGGIYFFQSHLSFFHVYKMTGLGSVMSATLLAPLLSAVWVLFLDIKTFMAPNILNGAKMQEDVGGSRTKFHVNLILSIAVAATVAVVFAIFLGHLRGANNMASWFYTSGPQIPYDTAARAIHSTPEFNPATFSWFSIGALWVGLTLFLRQTLFWFPHPIGFIMLINPLMASLWFSFFIGWICKKIVVRYGQKATFDKTRVIFIGLILGEIIAVVLWPLLGVLFDIDGTSIDLNRQP